MTAGSDAAQSPFPLTLVFLGPFLRSFSTQLSSPPSPVLLSTRTPRSLTCLPEPLADADAKKIVTQAYSPLGDGSSDLITGKLVTGIGQHYNKTGAQVSLRWLKDHGIPLSTKATSAEYLSQDLDAVAGSWSLSAIDLAALDGATKPSGKPSFICNS